MPNQKDFKTFLPMLRDEEDSKERQVRGKVTLRETGPMLFRYRLQRRTLVEDLKFKALSSGSPAWPRSQALHKPASAFRTPGSQTGAIRASTKILY